MEGTRDEMHGRVQLHIDQTEAQYSAAEQLSARADQLNESLQH